MVRRETLEQETFALYYLSRGGITWGDVMGMTRGEREWHIKRLAKAKKDEAAAMKKGAKSPSPFRRR